MRRPVKILANFLGAAKELTGEYADLAAITEDEQNQIRMSLTSRPDRKATAKLLAAKGLSTREIAEHTGWSFKTIARDLEALRLEARLVSPDTKNVSPDTTKPSKTGSAKTVQHRADVAASAAAEGVTEAPTKRYRILYADPPWQYGNTQPDYHTEQRDHYPVMPLADICALPIRDWCEDNAVLFLWVTSPMLAECFQVVAAWGFTYKANFVWDKIKHNMGHYNSVRHEFLLICVRGSCQPDCSTLIDSVQNIERGEHSAKPVEFFDIIETLYTHGPKLQIFPRKHRDGWADYGHVAQIARAAE
jgi:N6-adenosine-specific RNA methylase IME4